MKDIIFSTLLFITVILYSCSDVKPLPPQRLPEEEIPAYREAVEKISQYIIYDEKDSVFHLKITEDEAATVGVPPKYYRRMVQDMEYTNYLIREEFNSKGGKIEIE